MGPKVPLVTQQTRWEAIVWGERVLSRGSCWCHPLCHWEMQGIWKQVWGMSGFEKPPSPEISKLCRGASGLGSSMWQSGSTHKWNERCRQVAHIPAITTDVFPDWHFPDGETEVQRGCLNCFRWHCHPAVKGEGFQFSALAVTLGWYTIH